MVHRIALDASMNVGEGGVAATAVTPDPSFSGQGGSSVRRREIEVADYANLGVSTVST
jgi:hypothetical protein